MVNKETTRLETKSLLWRYGLSVGSTIVSLIFTLLLYPWVFRTSLFYPAILVSSWFGGRGPGIVAALLSAILINYFFLEPHRLAPGLKDIPHLLVFLISALLISWWSTARRQAEMNLKRARDELEIKVQERTSELRDQASLLDVTHDAIFVRAINGPITYWNRGAAELYDFTNEEAIGKVSHELLQTTFPEPLERINEKTIQAGRWEGELIHTKPDGSKVIVGSRWTVQRDESGNPVSIMETNNDITERKKGEEELRKQAELLNLAHDAIIVRNTESRVVFWNDGAEKTYGYTSKEAFGKVTHELLQTQFPISKEAVDNALETQGEWEGELKHITRSGDFIIVASRQTIRRDGGGASAILEINRDITDRKRAEEAFDKSQSELAHLTRMMTLGELAASIAHEVNQPLTAVITNANASLRWLAAKPPNFDEAREAILRITRDGNRASEVIKRTRALLKKTTPQKSELDINDAIWEISALAHSELRKNRVLFVDNLAPDLPTVLADRVQLQQVILNLIMNGIEAMSSVKDRPRILVVRTQKDKDGRVLISVQDSGSGIDASNIDHLFDAFYTTKAEGMGMGLSISRSIIEAHGGKIWALSNKEYGATFQFSLPTHDATLS